MIDGFIFLCYLKLDSNYSGSGVPGSKPARPDYIGTGGVHGWAHLG